MASKFNPMIVNRALNTLRKELDNALGYLQYDFLKDNEDINELLLGNLNSSIRNFQLINSILDTLISKEEMLENVVEVISDRLEGDYPDDLDEEDDEGYCTEESETEEYQRKDSYYMDTELSEDPSLQEDPDGVLKRIMGNIISEEISPGVPSKGKKQFK